jgi:hypothetical protein
VVTREGYSVRAGFSRGYESTAPRSYLPWLYTHYGYTYHGHTYYGYTYYGVREAQLLPLSYGSQCAVDQAMPPRSLVAHVRLARVVGVAACSKYISSALSKYVSSALVSSAIVSSAIVSSAT